MDYVTDMLVKNIIETVKKKAGKGSVAIKPFQVSVLFRIYFDMTVFKINSSFCRSKITSGCLSTV